MQFRIRGDGQFVTGPIQLLVQFVADLERRWSEIRYQYAQRVVVGTVERGPQVKLVPAGGTGFSGFEFPAECAKAVQSDFIFFVDNASARIPDFQAIEL